MKRAYSWLLAVAAAALVIGLYILACGAEYADPGEALVMKAFAGFEGGTPASFHPSVYTALSWLLYGLQSVLPGVPWLTVLLLALIAISVILLCRAMALCARVNGLPMWAGALVGAVCLASFGFQPYCRLSLAAVAALCGTAAVAQLFSIDFAAADDKRVLRGLLPSMVLLLFSICLNARTGVGSLVLWCLAALSVRLGDYSHRDVARLGMRARMGALGLALGVLICVFCAASFVAVRIAELGAMSEYSEWRRAYDRLLTFGAFQANISDDALKLVGWTREALNAVAGGFTYGRDVSADAMNRLGVVLSLGDSWIGARYAEIAHTALKAVNRPAALLSLGGCLSLALAGVITPCGSRARVGARLTPLWVLLAGLALCAAALLDGKADESVIMLAPCEAGLACMAIRAIASRTVEDDDADTDVAAFEPPTPASEAPAFATPAVYTPSEAYAPRAPIPAADAAPAPLSKRPLAVLGTVLLCVWAALGAAGAAHSLAQAPSHGDAGFEQALYDYALEHPQKLIFYSPRLAGDTRLFPDMSRIPDNVLLPDPRLSRSDATLMQLKRFGLDGWRFKTGDMLGADVLVAGSEMGPWQRLLPYLRQDASGDRYWASYEQLGVLHLYRLCER